MDDIVAKLKSQIGDDVQKVYDHEALFKEAAAEVLRLREALERVRDGYGPNHLSKFARDIARAALAGKGE